MPALFRPFSFDLVSVWGVVPFWSCVQHKAEEELARARAGELRDLCGWDLRRASRAAGRAGSFDSAERRIAVCRRWSTGASTFSARRALSMSAAQRECDEAVAEVQQLRQSLVVLEAALSDRSAWSVRCGARFAWLT